MNRILLGAYLLIGAVSVAMADGAMLQSSKSIQINAPAADVWNRVKDFNALNTWHPAVAKDEIVEGANNEPGAVRLLTLGDGGQIREKLLAFDAAGMNYSYAILEGVLPVSNYQSTVSVEADSDTSSTVTWSGNYDHAEGADDATATSTIDGVYQGGLENLKKLAEGM